MLMALNIERWIEKPAFNCRILPCNGSKVLQKQKGPQLRGPEL
jgi:hypothetical protein